MFLGPPLMELVGPTTRAISGCWRAMHSGNSIRPRRNGHGWAVAEMQHVTRSTERSEWPHPQICLGIDLGRSVGPTRVAISGCLGDRVAILPSTEEISTTYGDTAPLQKSGRG